MKTLLIYIDILFLLLFGNVSDSKANIEENIRIETNTSTTQVIVGDSLSIFCTVTIPEDVQVSEPYLKNRSPFLEIEKQWKEKETADSVSTTQHYNFIVYAFAPDSLSIGPFIVDYVTADGKKGSVLSNVKYITVTNVVGNPESPPLPNRNPLEIESKGISIWLIVLIIVLIIISAVILLYFIYRKITLSKPIPQEPIDEIGEFERIRKLKLHESGRLKELYIFVSLAMRGFIHRNMKFDAMYETTEEISKNLSKTSGDEKITRAFGEILEESDMVKFAKYSPTSELSSSVIDRALKPVRTVLEEIALKKELESSAATETELKTPVETSNVKSGRRHKFV